MRYYTRDEMQAALSFLVQQSSVIEREVLKIEYPDVQYPSLVPVDTSAPEWASSVTYFSLDRAGRAAWFAGHAKDMPLADVAREKHEETIRTAGIGYEYDLEELGKAMLMQVDLPTEKAEAARRGAEEFVDEIALRGDDEKAIEGLINNSSVTVVNAAYSGTGNSSTWDDKTADQILADVNDALTGVFTNSLQVEIADTILLPLTMFTKISTMRIPDTTMTVLQWIIMHNVYTQQTGQPLTIRAVRGLEVAGEGGVGRMVAYRRDPRVLKMHLPMPHRFFPVYQTGPIIYSVPGLLRVAGINVRRPRAMRYIDGIIDPQYA